MNLPSDTLGNAGHHAMKPIQRGCDALPPHRYEKPKLAHFALAWSNCPPQKGIFPARKACGVLFRSEFQMPSLLPPLTHEGFEGAFAANFRRLFPTCQRNFTVRQKHFAMKSPEEKVRINGQPLAGKFAG
jgi:hypothetical protein